MLHLYFTYGTESSHIINTEFPYTPGVHYWYDISSDMHCDQVFPVFLLYDQASQRLKSFGWAVLANLKSPLWENPPVQYLQVVISASTQQRVKLYVLTMMMNFLIRNLIRWFNISATRGYFASCITANNSNEHSICGLLTTPLGRHDWILAKFGFFCVFRYKDAVMLDSHAKLNLANIRHPDRTS